MKALSGLALFVGAAWVWLPPLARECRADRVEISSLKELAAYAGKSGNIVTMKPGEYQLADYLPLESMADRRRRKEFPFMTFGGSDNVFNLSGVTIILDTALREALHPPVHTDEFLLAGNNNTLAGLTIRHVGDGTSPGGAAFGITGVGNTLRDCAFHVRGSSPYGYGDLLGKGGGRKHSGLHVAGSNTRVIGCKLYMRSFGHGYYVQNEAKNIYFEDCYVEGATRSTDEMLAETSGPAFDRDFRSVYRNRRGEKRIAPGYMKSLMEDGFRTYGPIENITFKNCTAKYTRGGFELRDCRGARLENCVTIGTERGYWVSDGAVIANSKGDAQYGPLLFVEGDNVSVDLELAPTESKMTVHAVATIHGMGNTVTLRPRRGENRDHPLPILVGYSQPGGGEGSSPYGEQPARKLVLRNETTMPVVIGAKASKCRIITLGPARENEGKDISIARLPGRK